MKKILLFAIVSSAGIAFGATEPAAPVIRAQLTARNSAVLSAEIGAKIRQVLVIDGGAFHQGDLLVSFDDVLQRSQVARAQAVVMATQRSFATNQRLHHLNSVGQVELDLSEAEVKKAEAELAYAEAMLAKCRITAPFAGRVAEQKVHDQEFVQPGQMLLEIIDDATPQVDFIAPSKWLAWLRAGNPLEITIEETGRVYAAKVERIGARVDPVSQSVKIFAAFDQPAPELIAGMSGTISLSPPSAPEPRP